MNKLYSKENIYYQGNCTLKKVGVKLEYTHEQIIEIKKCKDDISYFLKKYVKVINIDKGKIPFELYDYQEKMIKSIQQNLRSITLAPRQSGKTVGTCGYLLHFMLFNKHKCVALIANKEKVAKKILSQIKQMFICLPLWLQQGVSEWNKTSIEFENGCNAIASATSGSAARGDSIAIMYIDEVAWVGTNIWDDFYSSVYPTVSSSKTAKIILSSTPWGMNHFYKLWADAESGANEFKPVRVYWQDVPGRDEAWKKRTINDIGQARFDVEFDCQFKGSAGTLLNSYTLQNMVSKQAADARYDEKFRIFKYPEEDRKYVVFNDVAEGLGQDSSTCQVIDVTDPIYEQVAVYEDDQIKTNIFPTVIKKIGEYYNDALVIVENNGIGDGVLNDLQYDIEYENIFYYDNKFGLRMTKGSKNNGNSYLKSFVEDQELIINDEMTIDQFNTYIKRGQSYSAEDKKHDDLITPLVLFSYFMNNKVWKEEWLDDDGSKDKSLERISKIEEELLPIGFMTDGDEDINMGEDEFIH